MSILSSEIKTSADLKLWITEQKLRAWEHLRHLVQEDSAGLAAAGYRNCTPAEAVLKAFQRELSTIEARIQKFERENKE